MPICHTCVVTCRRNIMLCQFETAALLDLTCLMSMICQFETAILLDLICIISLLSRSYMSRIAHNIINSPNCWTLNTRKLHVPPVYNSINIIVASNRRRPRRWGMHLTRMLAQRRGRIPQSRNLDSRRCAGEASTNLLMRERMFIRSMYGIYGHMMSSTNIIA